MLECVDVVEADERLGELALYLASQAADGRGTSIGRLRLYLYFSDFASVRKLGHPITGAEYFKLKRGPAPRRWREVQQHLIATGDATTERHADALGYAYENLVPTRPPRLALFGDEAIEVVDAVLASLTPLRGLQLEQLAQREGAWQVVPEGETIPYALAYAVPPDSVVITPEMRAKTERLLEKYADRLA